jgi:hypothetical protein
MAAKPQFLVLWAELDAGFSLLQGFQNLLLIGADAGSDAQSGNYYAPHTNVP